MGERKGQNKYYPPDYDPRVGGLNKFQGTHALRERARKIHLGIIIIRFEMPYNIWCEGCKNHIGMGVRYNAEKTKVGMYYSTSVYQFRMKCHLCDNYIVIKTDPGNLDYEIVSGAQRQENRWDPSENGQIVADTKEVQRRLFDDPMYKLEHVAADTQKGSDAKPRLAHLYKRSLDLWDDNYAANAKLRETFRKRKHEEKQLERPHLNMSLLPETQKDIELAAVLSFQPKRTTAENERTRIDKLINQSVLPITAAPTHSDHRRERILNENTSLKSMVIVKRRKVAETTVTNANNQMSEEIQAEEPVLNNIVDREVNAGSSSEADKHHVADRGIVESNETSVKSTDINTPIVNAVSNKPTALTSLIGNYDSFSSEEDNN